MPRMFNPSNGIMAKKIMVSSYKGGVGKTQTSLEMSYALAIKGYRVLGIDYDFQGNYTRVLSKDTPTRKRSLPDILIADDQIQREDISTRILDAKGNRIDFIASGLALGRLEKKLTGDAPKEYVLKDALALVEDDYDYIIIDTPPSAELVFTSALVASDGILITSQAAVFSVDGVNKVMPVIRKAQHHPRLNPNLQMLGILVCRLENDKENRRCVEDLRNAYGDLVLSPFIRKCSKVSESNRFNTFTQVYAPRCTSAQDYRQCFDNLFGAGKSL